MVNSQNHKDRAHSKFSASGAERWFNCSGSVELSEGQPDKSSVWSLEGTKAHEVLEKIMLARIENPKVLAGTLFLNDREVTREMLTLGDQAAKFILGLHHRTPHSDVQVESRVYLDFIHPEMFGTYDGAVVDHFGTLHVFDFKFGAGHAVSPKENLQMIFYGIGLAHKYHWNFKRVRLWIIQPRIKGYDGPMFWEISALELKRYVEDFQKAVARVEAYPDVYTEGGWCHWCKAKSVCPLKTEKRAEQAVEIFKFNKPERTDSGKEKSRKEKGSGESFGQKIKVKTSEEKELEAWYKRKRQKEEREQRRQQKEVEDFY